MEIQSVDTSESEREINDDNREVLNAVKTRKRKSNATARSSLRETSCLKTKLPLGYPQDSDDLRFSPRQKQVINESLQTFFQDVSDEIVILQRTPLRLPHLAMGNSRRERRHEIRKLEAESKRKMLNTERQRKKPCIPWLMSFRTFRRLVVYTLFICLFTYQFCRHVSK